MKIIRILGGLGNQMFQYAFAMAIKSHFPNEKILIDRSAFNGYPLHDGYLIDKIFGQNIESACKREILKLNYPFFHYRLWQIGKRFFPKLRTVYNEKVDMIYDPDVFKIDSSMYYDGYWQSEKYFSDYGREIKDAFSFPQIDDRNKHFLEGLDGQTVVSIHVRRGDYLNDPLFKGLTDLEYYSRAIRYILSITKIDCFVIFSNDMGWCRQNIPSLTDVTCRFVDWNTKENSFRDMQLMSRCSHNIIANSSFSWWGAWLNPNHKKIVIAPKRWINSELPTNIIPDSWIRL